MEFSSYPLLEKEFFNWCKTNNLKVEKIDNQVFACGGMVFLLLEEKEGNVCDQDYHFILSEHEKRALKEPRFSIDAVAYKWGTKFCYTKVGVMDQPDNDNVKLFKYLGETTLETPGMPFLGVHGQYEILNGSRNYGDWTKKAKFLGISTLGICEKNTLAGIMSFQEACQGDEIKSILGETITIKNENDLFNEGKVYALNEKGWKNILQINAEINVINPTQYIDEKRLLELGEGVVFVFDPLGYAYDKDKVKEYQEKFSDCYYKMDTVQYESDKTDELFLKRTQEYILNDCGLKPILICDAYYLDKEDYEIKKDLNLIAGVKTAISKNQYFKADDENLILLSEMFSEEDFAEGVTSCMETLLDLDEKSDYTIPTQTWRLPLYKMTTEEKEKYGDIDTMFDALLMEGWDRLKLSEKPNVEEYLDRLQKEVEVIKMGGFQNYFLILWDIIRWCGENDILVGLGRGSGAGCLCAWLLNLTKPDPIEYGLLFERFLNKGRMGYLKFYKINGTDFELQSEKECEITRNGRGVTVLTDDLKQGDVLKENRIKIETIEGYYKKVKKGTCPDLDTDFESARRDEVKKYMESKYGSDRVCSLGAYTSLQMRAVFRDFCKLRNVPQATVEFLSKVMFETRDNKNARASRAPWEYIFKLASRNGALYDFIQEHAEMIEETKLCHAAPRAASVHPCATLILPEGESIYTSVPIRKTELNGKDMVICEWEGPYVEGAGYLKEDILGIQQLDKFRMIIDLIKEHYGEKIDIYNLPLNDSGVYDMIAKGLTGDVFQLGSRGLTAYCMQVKPTSVRELCAVIALFRPGPMDNNFHLDYVELKNGRKEIEYFPGTEEITKETFGLLAYQEQIMLITTHLAGFTLVEADNIRKGMGKVDKKFFAEQGQKFIEGALKNGYDRGYVEDLWKKMCAFGGYAFNKSHSLCYGLTAYICQWLKCKYPLPYWITALEFASDDNLPRFISEINRTGDIAIAPPDINKSDLQFYADFDSRKIFWSISRVKQCGEVAVTYLLGERQKNGPFFDFKEFLFRVEKSKVNKSVVENLILAGAFDEMCSIIIPSQRKRVIEEYRQTNKIKVDENKDFLTLAEKAGKTEYEWWWLLQQKRVSGLAFFDYPTILRDNGYDTEKYLSLDEFELEDLAVRGTHMVTTAGIISEIEHKSSKKGDYCKFRIEQNYSFVWVTVWNEDYLKYEQELENCVGKIVVLRARAYHDSFKDENSLQSDSGFEMKFID